MNRLIFPLILHSFTISDLKYIIVHAFAAFFFINNTLPLNLPRILPTIVVIVIVLGSTLALVLSWPMRWILKRIDL